METKLSPTQIREIKSWPLARREALVAAANVSRELGGFSMDEALARAYDGMLSVVAQAQELFGGNANTNYLN